MIKLFHGLVGRMWSRSLHFFFRMRRGLTIGVRAIVRDESGKVLLVRHTYTPGWHFPGGGVEPGETANAALARELVQETGLQIAGRPKLLGVFFNQMTSRRDHILVYSCRVQSISSDPNFGGSPEISEVGWFDFDSLPAHVEEGTYRRLQELIDERMPTELW